MANPITWRTINSDSNAAANALLAQAGQTFSNALDSFGKVATGIQRDQITKQNDLVQKNTQDFLDTVSRYSSPEEIQKAQAEGVFRNMLTGYGQNIDRNLVRGAVDERLAGLQKQGLNAINFDNAQYAQKAAPIVDAYKAAVFANRDTVAAEILKANPWLRNQGELTELHNKQNIFEEDQVYKGESREREETRFNNEQDDRVVNKEIKDLQLRAAKRGEEENTRSKNIQTALGDAYSKYQESEGAWIYEIGKRAEEKGYGSDLSKLTPQQVHEITQSASAPAYKSITDARNAIVSTLSESYKLTPAERKAAGQMFDELTTASGTLSPNDKAAQDNALVQLDKEFKNNIYVADKVVSPADAAELSKSATKFLDDANDSQKTEFWKEFNEILSKGTVVDEQGNTLPVPKSLMMSAIQDSESGWFEIDQPLSVSLAALIKDAKLPEQYADYLNEYEIRKAAINAPVTRNASDLSSYLVRKATKYQEEMEKGKK